MSDTTLYIIAAVVLAIMLGVGLFYRSKSRRPQ